MLVVSAFESWLNELVKTPMHPDLELGLADRPIKCKYKGLSKLLNNDNECWCPDLDLVIELRNEIVHYKPRAVEAEGHVGDPVPYRASMPLWDRLQAVEILRWTAQEVSEAALQSVAMRQRREATDDVHQL